MTGCGDVFLQKVCCLQLDKAGGGAVGAGEPFGLRHAAVHDKVHGGAFREDGAQDGGGPNIDTGERPQFLCRG